MAKFDRCEVCDYSKETGSSYAGIPAYHNGEVRLRRTKELLCDACYGKPMPKSSKLDGEIEVVDEDDEASPALSEL